MGRTKAGARPQAEEKARSLATALRRLAKYIFLSDLAQAVNEPVDGLRQRIALRRWRRQGRALPPPHLVKERTVVAYARRFSTSILVETGTYLGAMIKATRGTFARIYSIELDPDLYKRARRKLAEPGRVSILHGDSAQVLPRLLASIHEPCLFWLDAHHSGLLTARGRIESPVMLELRHILNHPVAEHVVLIDDARAFVGRGGYPTIPELAGLVAACRPEWVCEVEDDIIRLHTR